MRREGQAQLAVWISSESMVRLRSMATDGVTIRDIVERAIHAYRPDDSTPAPLPLAEIAARLEDHERRLAALESNQQLDNELDRQLDSIINELAQQGLKQSAIAEALNQRGYQTTTGQPFHRGNSRIAKAVKLVSSQQLDNGQEFGKSEPWFRVSSQQLDNGLAGVPGEP